jgi:hypothetical protein
MCGNVSTIIRNSGNKNALTTIIQKSGNKNAVTTIIQNNGNKMGTLVRDISQSSVPKHYTRSNLNCHFLLTHIINAYLSKRFIME